MATIALDKNDFIDKIINFEESKGGWNYLSDKPSLIIFHEPWSSLCNKLISILDELAEAYMDDIYIYKVDIEKYNDLAVIFGIREIPTLLFIPINKPLQITNGEMSKMQLIDSIKRVLLK